MITRRAALLGLGASLSALALSIRPAQPPTPAYHIGRGSVYVRDEGDTEWRAVGDFRDMTLRA